MHNPPHTSRTNASLPGLLISCQPNINRKALHKHIVENTHKVIRSMFRSIIFVIPFQSY